VTINSITATGNFAIASKTCGLTLAAGASCKANVTFTPSVSGSITGSVAISDSAPDSPQTVALTGTGSLPISFSPATLSFGTVTVGHTSSSKTVALTNNETSTLSFSFATSGNYAVSTSGTTCGSSLASKAKCNVAITFSPTANGSINGALTITDSTSFGTQLVGLSGTGSGGAAAPLTFTPANLSFANQPVGTTSAGKTVTVKNATTGSVVFTSIVTSAEFVATGSGSLQCGNGLLLAAGKTCTMSVTFSPALGASGSIKGSLVFSDTGSITQQVYDVSGAAVLPLSFSPTSLTFTAQTVATTSATQAVTMTNNLSTSVSPTIIGNGDYAVIAGGATPCGSTLAAHASCTFTVTFTPTAIGTRTSAVTVTDVANPSVETLNVTGTGQ
jgi:hypothetical protein